VTSHGGLILVRELDERLGLEKLIDEHLSDSRRGFNKQFTLADLLRHSVYSRLAARKTSTTGKTELSEPRDLAGPAPVTNFVVTRQERCTMCQKLKQIGNPDRKQRSKDAERTRNGGQQ
jgi:hypothetical protein